MKTIDKIASWLVLAAMVLLVAMQFVNREQTEPESALPAIGLSQVQRFFPDAVALKPADTSYYIVENAEAQPIGTAMLSAPYSDGVKGYAGQTPLLICLDNNGKIFKVELLDNDETPGFVNRLTKSGYFDSWNGMSVEEALQADVDVVSGATYSSLGVQNSLKARLAAVARQQVASNVKVSPWGNVCMLVIVVMALVCFFFPQKTKTLRLVTLLLSVCVLGFWQNALLSLARFYGWLTSGFSWQMEWAVIVLLVLALLLPVFAGRSFYCAYLCPMGALQEFAGRACRKKVKVPYRLNVALLLVRKLLLLVVLILLLAGVGLNLAYLEPFSVFSVRILTLFSVAFAVVVLVVSLFVNRAWCRFLCPTGLLLELCRRKQNKRKKSA